PFACGAPSPSGKRKSPSAGAEGLGLLAPASRVRTRVNPSGLTSNGRAGAFASPMQATGWSWLRLSIRPGPRRGPAYDVLYAGRVRRACELPHSPHAPHLSPAFQRGPDTALEPEAVDRRRRVDRADAAQADAGPLEAALLQHAARRRVGDARARLQRLMIELAER